MLDLYAELNAIGGSFDEMDPKTAEDIIENLHLIARNAIMGLLVLSEVKAEESKKFYRKEELFPTMMGSSPFFMKAVGQYIDKIELGKDLKLKHPQNHGEGVWANITISNLYGLLENFRLEEINEVDMREGRDYSKTTYEFMRQKSKGLEKLTKGTLNDWASRMTDIVFFCPEALSPITHFSNIQCFLIVKSSFPYALQKLNERKSRRIKNLEKKYQPKLAFGELGAVDQTNFSHKKRQIESMDLTVGDQRTGVLKFIKERLKTSLKD